MKSNYSMRSPFDNRKPCQGIDCGEAGCVPLNGRPTCVCANLDPPNEDLECVPVKGTEVGRRNKIDTQVNDIQHNLLNFSSTEPFGQHQVATQRDNNIPSAPVTYSSGDDGVNLLKVIIPLALIPVVFGCFFLTLMIYKRNRKRQASMDSRRYLDHQKTSNHQWLNNQSNHLLLDHMTVTKKNPAYYSMSPSNKNIDDVTTKQIPSECLQIMEEIGEGAFGKVYKGCLLNPPVGDPVPVAVKVLKLDVSIETKEDFQREAEIMNSFDHPNITRLIGVVAVENHAPYMVFEYMEYGDLAELLRKCDPELSNRKLELTQNDLVSMSVQIAQGMSYLTSKHFVHRDLATRNCLVGANLVVRISDFGMSRDVYTCDYYKIQGTRMLPVRWMSPESVKYGRFTAESDVWAFGVVLWELCAFAKQPYYGHTNEEVIRFIEDGILLQRPKNTPDTLYHVMLACWRTNPIDRFNFPRILKHLTEYRNNISHQHPDNNKPETDTLC